MRERATLIGAELKVWSQLNSGTEIELKIPGGECVHKAVPVASYRVLPNMAELMP